MPIPVRARRVVALLAALVAAACHSATAPVADGVQVRFRNATPWSLTDVSLQSPGATLRADRLAPGATTAYERLDGAYAYGALRALAGGTVRSSTPTDYVGEQPLAAGRYTYVIKPRADDETELDLELKSDR